MYQTKTCSYTKHPPFSTPPHTIPPPLYASGSVLSRSFTKMRTQRKCRGGRWMGLQRDIRRREEGEGWGEGGGFINFGGIL